MASGSQNFLGRVVGALSGKLGSKDMANQAVDRIKRLGMTQRQQELNHLWAIYKCLQYDGRRLDWNGRENLDKLATDVVASAGYIPPGFYDASKQGASVFPLKFRRPTAPYALIRTIVDRFTGLLFSENQHPEVVVEGDSETEDWLRAVVQTSRLWQQMLLARTYGGSMGSVAVGFQFVNGKPVIEVHDPRWVFPEFTEHGSQELVKLEKRYRYPKEVLDPVTGKWEMQEFWYRRTIDQQADILYEPAPVDQGDEPEWVVAREVKHGFGFCPVIWVQNIPVQDAEDGDPDCPPSVYDNVEAIDALIAQANRGILANCDPTLVITSKAELGVIKPGSDNALHIPEGSASFLELQASGPKAALELAEQLRKNTLEMAQCVLEHPDTAGKTATEVERMYQSMLSKADVHREQYGQRCVLPLLEMLWRAANILNQPRAIAPVPQLGLGQVGETGQVQNAVQRLGGRGQEDVASAAQQGSPQAQTGTSVSGASEVNDGLLGASAPQQATIMRSAVLVPPRYEKDAMGNSIKIERTLGTGGTITLKWPGYFQPSLDDVTKAVGAAVSAMSGGVVDDETAINFVAPYFKVEDPGALIDRVRANASQQQADLFSQMMGGSGAPESGGEAGAPPPGPGEGEGEVA